MRVKKKRKAERIHNDAEAQQESSMPVRKTKDIADKHIEQLDKHEKGSHDIGELGEREDGKELFDFVLKGMAKPDSQ